MANVSSPVRIDPGWAPVVVQGRAPALYRIPLTLSVLGLFLIALQAGQPMVGFASMMLVLGTATVLSLRAMSRRYAPAAMLRDQGNAKLARGQYAEARAFYERSLAIVQRELPAVSMEVLLGHYNLAVAASLQCDHARVDVCLDALLSGLGGRVPNPWAGQMAWLLRRVALYHSLAGRHAKAMRACQLALELVGDAPGADDNTVRSLLDDLAWSHYRAGALAKAEAGFREALSVHEQYRDIAISLSRHDARPDAEHRSPYRAPSPGEGTTSGGLDRAVAQTLLGLGWTLLELGRDAEAEESFGRALGLCGAAAVDERVRVRALRGRAAVLMERGQCAEAGALHREAGRALGVRAGGDVGLLLDRARLACTLDEGPRARALLSQVQQKADASPHRLALHSALHRVSAELALREGQPKLALRHASDALEFATTDAPEHPRRAAVLALSSRLQTLRGDYVAAERQARESLDILRLHVQVEVHPLLADVYLALGELHAARGHWGAAELDLERALAARPKLPNAEHPRAHEALAALLGVYEATGRSDLAGEIRTRLDGIKPRG